MKMSNGFFFETIKKNNWQLYKSNNGAQKKNLARPKIENWKLQIEKNWKLQQIFYENNLHQENGRDKINLKKQFFIHFLPCCFFLNWIKFSLFLFPMKNSKQFWWERNEKKAIKILIRLTMIGHWNNRTKRMETKFILNRANYHWQNKIYDDDGDGDNNNDSEHQQKEKKSSDN